MRAIPLILASVVLQFQPAGWAVGATSPSEDLDASVAKMSATIATVGRLIGSKGDASLQLLFNRTRFSVGKFGLPNLGVSQGPVGFTIYAAAEYQLLTTYIADVNFALMGHGEQMKCAVEYTQHLTREINKIRGLAASGMSTNRLLAPEEFALDRRDICSGFADLFPIPIPQRGARDQAVTSVVVLSLLHELGHIALGHRATDFEVLAQVSDPGQRMKIFLELSRRARTQEDAADRWAVDQAVALGAMPFDVINPTLIGTFIAFTGADCTLENADDHSNGVARVKAIVSRYILESERVGRRIPEEVKLISKDYFALAEKARVKLSCPK